MDQIRQGDVLLVKTTKKLSKEARPVQRRAGRVVLALGEATGHAHVIVEPALAELFEERDGALYLKVEGPCELRHVDNLDTLVPSREHDSTFLTRGLYCLPGQREYAPEAIRPVAD